MRQVSFRFIAAAERAQLGAREGFSLRPRRLYWPHMPTVVAVECHQYLAAPAEIFLVALSWPNKAHF